LANVTEGLSTSSRQNLSRSTGAIQVSGTEDLGGGLKAGFRIEELIQGGQTSANRAVLGTGLTVGNLGSRQSFLTVGGGFGTVKVGRDLDANAQMIGVGNVSGANAWVGLDGSTDNSVYYGNIRSNSVSYSTPTIAGFTASFGISPADYSTLGTRATTTAPAANGFCAQNTTTTTAGACDGIVVLQTNPLATSVKQDNPSALAVTYSNGPLNAGLVRTAYEGSSNTVATTLAGNYDFGFVKVGALRQTLAADAKETRTATVISANAPIGAFALQAAYGKSDASAAVTATKSVKHTLLGVQYNLSKRTSAYFVSSNKKVDGATASDFDHKETGFGIKHAF
jgi:predicted porin